MQTALLLLTLGSLHVFTPKKGGPLSLRKSKRVAMSVKRSLESEIEISVRKNKDSVRKAKNRALEDDDQFLQRKKRDSARTAKKRASETQEEALCRQERDRACTAKKRASETQGGMNNNCSLAGYIYA